jgi:regulator of replication initiation timing
MTKLSKASDFLFLSGDEWETNSEKLSENAFPGSDFLPRDDEQRASATFQALLNSLTQIGAEVSLLKYEMESLKIQNTELQLKFDVLKSVVAERESMNIDELDVACDTMNFSESEEANSVLPKGSHKKCEFLH